MERGFAINRMITQDLAQRMIEGFIEVIIAPGFDEEAIWVFSKRKNLRLLALKEWGQETSKLSIREVDGGLLLQEKDLVTPTTLRFVTKTRPHKEELSSLLFAMKVAKHTKSNAIVLAKGKRTVGIGAGQMSRIDAARFAILKAGQEAKGSVLASDAFFPFRDVVDEAARAGIRAIIQPGGSKRDEESISAANEHGIPMVFTGIRHFRH